MTRAGALRRIGLLLVGANAVLFVLKGAVWYATGSVAVGSEAVNSLTDAAYSLVVLGGLYLTTRPADGSHPHGHERIEPFVALVVGLGVLAAGGAVLYGAGRSVLAGASPGAGGPLAAGVLLVGAVAKVGLYRYCLRVARTYSSPAVEAAAMDNRADVLTAVAALAGVLGAAAGVPVLDPLAGAVVAVSILHTGGGILRSNVDYLVGRAPPAELRERIVERALEHPDVEGVHDVVAHYVGPEVDVSLHIEVQGDRTIREAHDIETELIRSIGALEDVDDVFVHLDPKELGEWVDDGDDADPETPRDPGRPRPPRPDGNDTGE
jgi:cation diffusion facilitator family transporter